MSDRARELCRRARARGFATDWQGAPALGALLVAGPDAGAFLHAQLTSDVAALGDGRGQWSARLDRKGALVAWFSLHRLPARGQPFASYLLILPRDGVVDLRDDLAAYVIAEDVVLEDVTDEFDGRLEEGPAVTVDMDELAVRPEPAGWTIARSSTGDPGRLRLAPRGELPPPPDDLDLWPDDADARLAWTWLEIEAGMPRVGRDLAPRARVLPQTGLEDRVLSATAGCFLGQEVVARIRTYGSVPRALRGLVFTQLDGDRPPAFPTVGADLATASGEKAGAWASGGLSTVLGRPVALAYLGRAQRTPGTRLEVMLADGEAATAEVVLLPFHGAADAGERSRRLYERAVHSFGRGADREAVGLLEEALRLDPHLADAYEALGVILGRGERFHAAIDVFRRLEEIAPHEPMVHTNLSRFYMRLGDKEEAERQLALATEKRFAGLDDAAEAARRAEAEEAARRADAEQKLAMFREVLEIDADDPLALMGMGRALAVLERFDAAEPYLARARRAQPDNSAAHAAHGKVLERLGREAEAADAYREGVAVASRKGDLMPLKEMEHRLLLLGGGAPGGEAVG